VIPKLLIFDLDDTLVDWEKRARYSREKVAHLFAGRLGGVAADWLEMMEARDVDFWSQVTRGELPHEELATTRMRHVLQRWGHNDDADLIAEACRLQVEAMVEQAYVDQEVHDLLGSLKERYSMYLLTNGLAEFQWLTLRDLTLEDYFDEILICSDLRCYKPDTAPFREALQRAQVDPADAWMIGNSWTDDVMPALELGMTTVWINASRRPSPNGQRPHFDIENVVELEQILRQRERAARIAS
jgi:HAD superfamily hydrolase (TIGR01549 family)